MSASRCRRTAATTLPQRPIGARCRRRLLRSRSRHAGPRLGFVRGGALGRRRCGRAGSPVRHPCRPRSRAPPRRGAWHAGHRGCGARGGCLVAHRRLGAWGDLGVLSFGRGKGMTAGGGGALLARGTRGKQLLEQTQGIASAREGRGRQPRAPHRAGPAKPSHALRRAGTNAVARAGRHALPRSLGSARHRCGSSGRALSRRRRWPTMRQQAPVDGRAPEGSALGGPAVAIAMSRVREPWPVGSGCQCCWTP